MEASSATVNPRPEELEVHRRELTAYCYRMLGSPFEAEDAVQDTLLRAWRGSNRFEGRSSLRSWLYRIATNVCIDALDGRKRRARPIDLGPAREADVGQLTSLPEEHWIEPAPDALLTPEHDPAEVVVGRETVRLAFVAVLQRLPPRQRAALVLCEVLHWRATEAAELLDMSVAALNSALQRARSTLADSDSDAARSVGAGSLDAHERQLLARYVHAFERYDMDALTSLIHEDAAQSMPPYELWLRGREDILRWWVGPGAGCRGSRVIPTLSANGSPAFGQYKPSASGQGFEPWALQVVEIEEGRIVELTFFLSTERLFPLFGLPPRLEA